MRIEFEQQFERGIILFQTGQLQAALKLWQQLRVECRKSKNLTRKAKVLNALGNTYNALGSHQDALKSHQQQLNIVKKINDVQGEENAQIGLGKTFHFLGDRPKAINSYQKALEIAQTLEDHLGKAIALGNLGNVYESWAKYSQAIDYHQQALLIFQDIGDRLGEANSFGNLGNACSSLSQYKKAIEYYQQGLETFRELGDLKGETNVIGNLGNAYYSIGEYQLALECHERVLATAKEFNDPQVTADSLNNLGNVDYSLGNYQQAIEYFQESLDIAKNMGDCYRESNSLNNLGNVYDGLGQYAKAINYHQQSLAIAQKINNRRAEARAVNNIASVYDSLGQYKKAIEYFQLSLAIEREIGNRLGESQSLCGIGNAYDSLGKFSEAVKYHHQQLLIAQEIGDRQREAQAIGGLGNVYKSQGQYSKAIDYHQQSLAIKQKIGDRLGESSSLNNLGRAYHFLGQYQVAANHHQQSLHISQEINDGKGEGISLINLGWALFCLGQLEEAESNLSLGVEVWESFRIGLKDEHNISLFEEQVRIYRLLQKVLVTQGKFAEALEISERGRSRAFTELLAQRSGSSPMEQVIATPPNIQEIQQIVQQQQCPVVEYSLIYDYFELQGVPSVRETELMIWVIQPNGEISFVSVALEPPSEKQRNSLGFISDLVLKLYRILNPDIKDKSASKTTEHIEPENFNSLSKILQQLNQLLIQPISHLLPTSPNIPVIFIPQDCLFLLPFSALQDMAGQFLIEKHRIITVTSIQLLELIHKRNHTARKRSLNALVVGNPKMPTIPLTEPPVQLDNLPWAESEAKAIANLLKIAAITGEAATKVTVKQQMSQARLIHLATHGLLDDIKQQNVPGAIALAPTEEDSGFLSANEIYDMKINAELVVLSACSTGQGKISGDGIIGLSRCLMAAGVKSLIVSLWSVGDLSTALMMVKFYQILQQPVEASIALNEAQRWLLNVNKRQMLTWLDENQEFFDASLKLNLRRRLYRFNDNVRLFANPIHWAAFFAAYP